MSDTVAIWMPLHIKDRRARAATLSHVEHSVLSYLEMLLWEHDATLPDDDRWLAKELRLSTRQWATMRATMLRGCTVAGGRIHHAGIAAELAKARSNVEQRRAAGRASAAARKRAAQGSASERSFNDRSTDVATSGQPRAGGGGGVGINHCQEGEVIGVEPTSHMRGREGLRVLPGGGK